MSQISVPNYPSDNLVPGAFFSIDATQANTASVTKRALLIGPQNTSAIIGGIAPQPLGSLPTGVPYLAGSVASVQAATGNGSPLALMYAAFRKVDPYTEVWLLPFNDDAAATYASYTLTMAGQATAAGTLSFYGAGQLVQVPVQIGQGPVDIFAEFNRRISLAVDLPFIITGGSVQNGTFTITVSSKVKGLLANTIDLNYNYLGSQGGEDLPPGIGVGVGLTSAGTGVPSVLPTYLANLDDKPYDYIATAYNDVSSLNAIQSFLNDQTGRWSIFNQIFGHAFFAFSGTVSQRATFFAARNDQHASGIGYYQSPSTSWEWAASLTAAVSNSNQEDPALPVTGTILPVLAPRPGFADSISERQTMLTDGCSTVKVNNENQVVLERVVTTYTLNPATSAPDNSYRDVETMYTLMAVIRDLRIQLQTQFARKKLVADGTPLPGGSNVVTSQTVLAAAISRYRTQANVFGWVQNAARFAKNATAQNAGGGVVRLFLPVDLANQLRVIAADVQFVKS